MSKVTVSAVVDEGMPVWWTGEAIDTSKQNLVPPGYRFLQSLIKVTRPECSLSLIHALSLSHTHTTQTHAHAHAHAHMHRRTHRHTHTQTPTHTQKKQTEWQDKFSQSNPKSFCQNLMYFFGKKDQKRETLTDPPVSDFRLLFFRPPKDRILYPRVELYRPAIQA